MEYEHEHEHEHEGYSIVVRVYHDRIYKKNILMGIKLNGIDESTQNSSMRLYGIREEAIESMTQKIMKIKRNEE